MKKKILLLCITLFSSSMLFAQAPSLWGMAAEGGSGNGTIFKSDSTGSNFHAVFSFNNANGDYPLGNLCLANNGKLYGVTELGGWGNSCVIFEYDTATNTCIDFYDFYFDQSLGWNAVSGMINSSDGNLYGMCASGGTNNSGVLYRIDPLLSTYTVIYNFGFGGISSGNNGFGSYPTGGLLELSDGKLYGMTQIGGLNAYGIIFSYGLSDSTLTSLHSFSGVDGASPKYGSLIQATDGKLYGMTKDGGTNNMGVIFSYDLFTNTYADIYDFEYSTGVHPYGSLIQADNGKLYGLTHDGGINNFGVLFNFNLSSGIYTDLFDFNLSSGRNPERSLIQASNGNLFGTTPGTGFKYDINSNTFTRLFGANNTIGYNLSCDILETGARSTPHTFESVHEINSPAINLFPSPVTENILITGNSISINDMVTVTDVTGRIVLQQKISQSQHVNLNVALLPAGVYFAEVKMQNSSVVKRFVKE